MSEKRHYWCKSTNSNSKVTEFTWTIEDFGNRPHKTGDFLYSSGFVIKLPNAQVSQLRVCCVPVSAATL